MGEGGGSVDMHANANKGIDLWPMLLNNTHEGFLMGCSFSDKAQATDGLVSGHAYSILGCQVFLINAPPVIANISADFRRT